MFNKRYLLESFLWIVGFVLAIEGADRFSGWLASLGASRNLALVPIVITIGFGLWVELRQIQRIDELHRLMYLIATLTGSMLAVAFCAVASIGEVLAGWPRVAPVYIIGVMGGGFVIGWVAARYRYR